MKMSTRAPAGSTLRLLTAAVGLLSICTIFGGCGETSTGPYEPPLSEVEITPTGYLPWTNILDVDMSAGYAFCAFEYGLVVFDVSDAQHPVYITQLIISSGDVKTVTVDGNLAILTVGNDGLRLVEISNPRSPILAGQYTWGPDFQVTDVAVLDNYVYALSWDDGLHVVDIANPYSPTRVGRYDVSGTGKGVFAAGDFLCVNFAIDTCGGYIGCPTGWLQFMDISDRQSPKTVGAYSSSKTCPSCWDAVGLDGRIFMVGEPYRLDVLNILDPLHPYIENSLMLDDFATGICIDEKFVYVVLRSGLEIFDYTDGDSLKAIGRYDSGSHFEDFESIDIDEQHAYIRNEHGVILILDLSNPAAPYRVRALSYPTMVYGSLSVSNSWAYVAAENVGLMTVDISDRQQPRLRSILEFPGTAEAIFTEGNYAYVACGDHGLKIVDVSNPSEPKISGECATPGAAVGVTVSEERAFVADGDLSIIDVSNPGAPAWLDSYEIPGEASCVTGDGNYVFVGSDKLYVVDIANPMTPEIVGSCTVHGSLVTLELVNDILYAGGDSLNIINVADVANPYVYSFSDGTVCDVAIDGDYAAIACGEYYCALRVLNISTPWKPRHAGQYGVPGVISAVYLNGQELIVVESYGLRILAISRRS